MNLYFKVENSAGQRIQEIFVQGQPLKANQLYTAAFVTSQGVLDKYGFDRKHLDLHAVEGLRKYLAARSPVDASLKGAVIAV
jgi:S-sulfosulfanyl-L-cysteine sulfohydrolase